MADKSLTLVLGPMLMLAGLVAGCRPADQIAVYTVPKPDKIIPEGEKGIMPTLAGGVEAKPAPTAPTRMLAAMFVVGESGWFFKATGDPEKLGAKEPEFLAFLKTVKFADEKEPAWELPAGWSDKGEGSEFRFTTLRMGSDSPPLELAVSRLQRSVPNETAFVLMNINRWRGQVGLKDLKPEELEKETSTLEIDGKKCIVVNYVGQMAAVGGMRGPFAAGVGAPAGGPPASPSRESTAAPATPASDLKYEKPESWKPGKLSQFRQAAFEVVDGKEQAEVTVSTFPLGTGTLLANVNRWRQQVGLKDVSEAELASSAKPIAVGKQEGKFIAAFGEGAERKGVLGVILETSDRMWFVKLIGDADLAQREQANFEAFVKSLQVP